MNTPLITDGLQHEERNKHGAVTSIIQQVFLSIKSKRLLINDVRIFDPGINPILHSHKSSSFYIAHSFSFAKIEHCSFYFDKKVTHLILYT